MGGLQDANSPIIEELIFLHDFINMILVFIITFVMFIIITIMLNSFINKNLLERQIIECIWTIIPAVILIQIAIPSLLLLYILDESIDSNLTIKPSVTNGTEGTSTEISERLEITLKSNSTRIWFRQMNLPEIYFVFTQLLNNFILYPSSVLPRLPC